MDAAELTETQVFINCKDDLNQEEAQELLGELLQTF
jgi:hypothetical protein